MCKENQRISSSVLTSHCHPNSQTKTCLYMFVERWHGRNLFCLSPYCGQWMALLVLGLYTLFNFIFFNGKTMTFGWASLSMALLKSSRDKMCFCSDVFEKLWNKTPSGNTPVMLKDPVFLLKGRWEDSLFCYHLQKTVLSEHCGQLLWTVHHTVSLAKLAVAFSLFRLWAAGGITMWLFTGWWRFAYSSQKFSSVWNMTPCYRVD